MRTGQNRTVIVRTVIVVPKVLLPGSPVLPACYGEGRQEEVGE